MISLSIICVFFVVSQTASFSLDYDGTLNIKLEHALNSDPIPKFIYRGNVTIQSLRVGEAIINQIDLTDSQRRQIQQLAESNDLYRVRATAISDDGTERSFMSIVKACMLAESELEDRLSISLDYTGRVIGITSVVASKSTCEGVKVPLENINAFSTSVHVRHPESPPIPDTASLIQRLEKDKEAKDRGEVKDNRSFLAKYWMYIVPVILIMVISGASNPEAQQAATVATAQQ